MKNGGKNKSVAFIILFSIYIYIFLFFLFLHKIMLFVLKTTDEKQK